MGECAVKSRIKLENYGEILRKSKNVFEKYDEILGENLKKLTQETPTIIQLLIVLNRRGIT